ncbi:MAG: hypothetical protein AB1758_29950, partial [Candidatus Eremiobacterota bacterium]
KLKAQGLQPDLAGLHRREALGTFEVMDQVGIALTPEQQALRADILEFENYNRQLEHYGKLYRAASPG